jgi:Ulp1 family protease
MTVIPIHATYLPLHSEPKDRNHWCVAVVSELDNEYMSPSTFLICRYHALYLDSLFSMKHFYSLVEFANSRGKTLRSAKVPDVYLVFFFTHRQSPSQPNSSDCGIFTIHYVKIITENVQYFQDGMKGMFGLDKDKQRVIDWKAEKLKDARSELKKEIKQSITYRL